MALRSSFVQLTFLSRQVCERLDTHLLSILRESKFRPLRQEVPRRTRMDLGHPEQKLSPARWRWFQFLGNRETGSKRLFSCFIFSFVEPGSSRREFEEMLATDNANVLPVPMDCLTVCTARLVVSVRSPFSLPTSPSCGNGSSCRLRSVPHCFHPEEQ